MYPYPRQLSIVIRSTTSHMASLYAPGEGLRAALNAHYQMMLQKYGQKFIDHISRHISNDTNSTTEVVQ